jgi:hypothetical protein
MGEQHGGTYNLIDDDGGRDRSMFCMGEQCGGTYSLIINNEGGDRSAFSVSG